MKPFGERLKKLLFVTMKTNRQVLQHDEGHPVWPLSKRKGGTMCCNGFYVDISLEASKSDRKVCTYSYKILAVFNILANFTQMIVSIHKL